MPVELRILAFGALLLFVHIFVAIRFKTAQYGRKWNVGARDDALAPANEMTGRTRGRGRTSWRRSRSRSWR